MKRPIVLSVIGSIILASAAAFSTSVTIPVTGSFFTGVGGSTVSVSGPNFSLSGGDLAGIGYGTDCPPPGGCIGVGPGFFDLGLYGNIPSPVGSFAGISGDLGGGVSAIDPESPITSSCYSGGGCDYSAQVSFTAGGDVCLYPASSVGACPGLLFSFSIAGYGSATTSVGSAYYSYEVGSEELDITTAAATITYPGPPVPEPSTAILLALGAAAITGLSLLRGRPSRQAT